MKADIRVGEGLDPPDGKSLIFHIDLSLREQAGQDPPLQEVLRETNNGYKAYALYMRDPDPLWEEPNIHDSAIDHEFRRKT